MSIFNKDAFKYTVTKISTSAIDAAESAAKATKGGANAIVKKSNSLLELSKLNSCISDETDKIYELYMKIGQGIYDSYKENTCVNTTITDLCSTIKDTEAAISVMKQRILDLKNIVMCPKCNIKLKNNISFCPFCGTALAKSSDCSTDNDPSIESIVTIEKSTDKE